MSTTFPPLPVTSDESITLRAEILAIIKAANPAGTIAPYGGTSIPSGWLACDGSDVSRITYSRLFSAIGETWGAGDGTSTFGLPDLQGVVLVGVGTLGANTYALADTGGEATHVLTTGEIPGHTHGVGTLSAGNQSASHTHSGTTGTQSASHTHTTNLSGTGSTSHTHTGSSGRGSQSIANSNDATETSGNQSASHTHTVTTGNQSASHSHSLSGSTASAGSGGAHENRQPYAAVHYMIRY